MTPPIAARAAEASPLFLHDNGYLVRGPFLAFYEANGGAEVFGRPQTDAFIEPGGLTVQYFTYSRFEWLGDHTGLTHLGRIAAEESAASDAFAWIASGMTLPKGRAYYPESGHTLGGAFAWYWQQHGALAILGYPISEEFSEAQADGSTLLVQYFERAALRYHPATVGTEDEVQRAPLGTRYALRRPTSEPPTALVSVTLSFRAGSGDGKNIALAASKLNGQVVEPGARLSFLSLVGPVTEEAGYVAGSAIVDGKVVNDAIGGGICTVSTLLYRAAWIAGLPIETRSSHSYWLRAYADMPGVEAAVDDPGLDLVIRNDLASPLFIEATTTASTVTLRLWGVTDGRKVTLAAPEVYAGTRNGNSADASVAPSGRQLAGEDLRRDGAEVVNVRVVQGPGKPPRRERVVTYYAPMPPVSSDNSTNY